MKVRRIFDSLFTLQNSLILISFLALIALRLEDFCNDPGLGWHLSTGEYVSSTGSIPKSDPFLFPELRSSWIADQWLADLIFYKLQRILSWSGLYAILIIVYAASFSLLPLITGNRVAAHPLAIPLAVIYCFILGSIHFICRPVIFSFLCFSALFSLLYLKSKSGKYTFSWPENFLMLVIFGFWANTHPSFILGFALLFFYLLESVLVKNRDVCGNIIKTTLLSLLATMLNPAFLNLHESVLFLGKSKFAINNYVEWQPIPVSDPLFGYVALPLLCFLILVFLRRFIPANNNVFAFLSLVVFFIASLRAVRFMPYYGIVSVPVVTALVEYLFSRIHVLNSPSTVLADREKQAIKPYYLFAVLALLLFSYASLTGRIPFYRGEFGPNSKIFPYEAVTKLKRESDVIGRPVRVLNSVNFGGFITFAGEGKVKAYIDDRTSLFRDEYYYHYMKYFEGKEIMLLAKTVKADFVLLQRSTTSSDLIKYYRKNYKNLIVYADDRSLLLKSY